MKKIIIKILGCIATLGSFLFMTAAAEAAESPARTLTGLMVWLLVGAAFVYAVYTLVFENRR